MLIPVLNPAQITSEDGTMTLSLDPVLPSFTLGVVEIGTGLRTLRLAWASVKDLQLQIPPSLLPQEDLVPRFQTVLLLKLDATGLGANMGLIGTTMTASVVKSATAQNHVMDLSVPQEPPAR